MPQRVVIGDAPRPEFKLTPMDTASPLWSKLSRHLKTMLQEAREKNDSSMDDRRTAEVRGEIAAYKKILKLGDDRVDELRWDDSTDLVGSSQLGIIPGRAR